MNKARITYRFDSSKGPGGEERRQPPAREEPGKVIPLYEEEYRVMEEQKEAQPQAEPGRDGRPRREEAPIRDYQPLNQYTTDYGAWSSPFDAETQRIEDLIRESNEREGRRPLGETAGKMDRYGRPLPEFVEREPYPEPEDDRELKYDGHTGYYRSGSDYRDVRDVRDIRDDRFSYDGPSVTGPRYVRHSNPPWLKIAASVTGAAVTGVLLGFFALSLFSGSNPITDSKKKDAAAETAQSAQEAKPVSAAVQATDAKAAAGGSGLTAAATGKEVALSYAGKTYSFLQSGSFAGQQGADQVKNDLLKKGLAAATEQSDKYYVFAGVATDKESATALSQKLKDSNKLDIYVKAYTVPSVTKVHWNGNADTLKSYLEQADKLLNSINLLTVINLDGEKPGAIEASTLQSVSTAHTAWSQLSNTVAQDAGDNEKALIQRMNNAVNSAKASLDEYKKNPSAAMLWQAQTYMMQYIIGEKELLSRLAA